MIDIHCHILPGLDDGPSCMKESIEMAKIAYGDGIRKIVATPHVKGGSPTPEKIEERIKLFQQAINNIEIELEVYRGSDFSLFLNDEVDNCYSINRKGFLLIELPHAFFPPSIREKIFKIQHSGLKVIVSHPERNPAFMRRPGLLSELIDAGVLIQITADSLVGNFGVEAKEFSKFCLRRGLAHFIATDSHSSKERRPVMSDGLCLARKIVGNEMAQKLVYFNPSSVLEGEEIYV